MEDMLNIYADAALKQTPASVWDTAGWNWFLMMAKEDGHSNDEKLNVWINAIDSTHERWTRKYRQYAAANGIHAKFSELEVREREEKSFASDMSEWDAVKLKRIERIDGILKFFTEDNESFEMQMEDIFTQLSFKKAFAIGTNVILPDIKKTSYAKFIASLAITKVENIGATLFEKIEEVLEIQASRLKEMGLETEQEALEAVESRSFAYYKECLYFRVPALLSEIRKDHPSVKSPSLYTILRDMGAENLKHRKFNFWKYDLATQHS